MTSYPSRNEAPAEPYSISDSNPGRSLGSLAINILAQNAWATALTSLALSVALVAAYAFFAQPLFSSNTYVAATRENLLRMNVFLQSPLILDPAAEKAGLNLYSHDIARLQMNSRISFKPAPGDNRPDAQIFMLSVRDSSAQNAYDISNLIVSQWKQGLTPKSPEKERIESELGRQVQKKNDLDNIVSHFGKEVTTYVTPQTNSGEVATPLVALLNQRADLTKRIEDLRYQLEGGSAFTIIAGPTRPDDARRSIGWATFIVASVVSSSLLVAAIIILASLWREARNTLRKDSK